MDKPVQKATQAPGAPDMSKIGSQLLYLNRRIVTAMTSDDYVSAARAKEKRDEILNSDAGHNLVTAVRAAFTTLGSDVSRLPAEVRQTAMQMLPESLELDLRGRGRSLEMLENRNNEAFFMKHGVARDDANLMSRLFTLGSDRLDPDSEEYVRASRMYKLFHQNPNDPAAMRAGIDNFIEGVQVIRRAYVDPANPEAPSIYTLHQAGEVFDMAQRAKLTPDDAAMLLRTGRELAMKHPNRPTDDAAYLTRYATDFFEANAMAAAKTPGYSQAFKQFKQAGLLDAASDPSSVASGIAAATPKLRILDNLRAPQETKDRYMRVLAVRNGISGAMNSPQYREDMAALTRDMPALARSLSVAAGADGGLSSRDHADALRSALANRVAGSDADPEVARALDLVGPVKRKENLFNQVLGGNVQKHRLAEDFSPLVAPDSTLQEKADAARRIMQNMQRDPSYYPLRPTGSEAEAIEMFARLAGGDSETVEFLDRREYLIRAAREQIPLGSAGTPRGVAAQADRKLRTLQQDLGSAMRTLARIPYSGDVVELEEALQNTTVSVDGSSYPVGTLLNASPSGRAFIEQLREKTPESLSLVGRALRKTDQAYSWAVRTVNAPGQSASAVLLGAFSDTPGKIRSLIKDPSGAGERVITELLRQDQFIIDSGGGVRFAALPSKQALPPPEKLSAYGKTFKPDQANEFAETAVAGLREALRSFAQQDPAQGIAPEVLESAYSVIREARDAESQLARLSVDNPDVYATILGTSQEEATVDYGRVLQLQESLGLAPDGAYERWATMQQRQRERDEDRAWKVAQAKSEFDKNTREQNRKLLEAHLRGQARGEPLLAPEVALVLAQQVNPALAAAMQQQSPVAAPE